MGFKKVGDTPQSVWWVKSFVVIRSFLKRREAQEMTVGKGVRGANSLPGVVWEK